MVVCSAYFMPVRYQLTGLFRVRVVLVTCRLLDDTDVEGTPMVLALALAGRRVDTEL